MFMTWQLFLWKGGYCFLGYHFMFGQSDYKHRYTVHQEKPPGIMWRQMSGQERSP